MISEIAPIVAYLKFIINDEFDIDREMFFIERRGRKNSKASNIIFIEEPEAHLHPEVQVKLMEIFKKLTQCNVKIIMTTHSNYMYNKLTNLILSKEIQHQKVGSYLMVMSTNGSHLDEIAMKADKDGIVDENFLDVSEKLFDERLKIIEGKNK